MCEYLGFRERIVDGEDVNKLYDCTSGETFECLQNEFLIAKNPDGSLIDVLKCKNNKLVRVPFKTINSRFIGKVKPRNIQQQMAVDLLYDSDVTVKILTGKFGTGKDFLMCSAAIDLIERDRFEKIVYVRNNIEVKDSRPIGFLPGADIDKLLPFAMPMADKLGGVDGLMMWMNKGQVELVHLGFIRGRDIRNSIVICSEAENMTKEHIQLLLGRIGEGSELWLNGDFKQCDADVFRKNSGLMAAVEKLKGHPRFGYVKLLKTERSETAAMADLLD